MALPLLDAMHPAFASTNSGQPKAKRFVGVSLSLGLHSPNWIPEGNGTSYKTSRYLRAHKDLRNDMTIVSGSSIQGLQGGIQRKAASFLPARTLEAARDATQYLSINSWLNTWS